MHKRVIPALKLYVIPAQAGIQKTSIVHKSEFRSLSSRGQILCRDDDV